LISSLTFLIAAAGINYCYANSKHSSKVSQILEIRYLWGSSINSLLIFFTLRVARKQTRAIYFKAAPKLLAESSFFILHNSLLFHRLTD